MTQTMSHQDTRIAQLQQWADAVARGDYPDNDELRSELHSLHQTEAAIRYNSLIGGLELLAIQAHGNDNAHEYRAAKALLNAIRNYWVTTDTLYHWMSLTPAQLDGLVSFHALNPGLV